MRKDRRHVAVLNPCRMAPAAPGRVPNCRLIVDNWNVPIWTLAAEASNSAGRGDRPQRQVQVGERVRESRAVPVRRRRAAFWGARLPQFSFRRNLAHKVPMGIFETLNGHQYWRIERDHRGPAVGQVRGTGVCGLAALVETVIVRSSP